MRILLAPVGSRGDVQPLIALGRKLKARGHAVSFLATLDFQDWARTEGFRVLLVPLSAKEIIRRVGDRARNPLTFLRTMEEVAVPLIESTDQACRDVDLVIGAGPQGAAVHFCEARGIRCLFACYCPVVLRSAHLAACAVPFQGLPRSVNRLTWWAQDFFFDRLIGFHQRALRRRLGLAPVPRAYDHWTLARDGVLGAFDPELCPAPPDWPDRVTVTGAWVYEEPSPLPEETRRFLDAGAAPVYVGFGSMPISQAATLTQLVVDAFRLAGVRGLIGAGWAGLGEGSALPDTVKVLPAVDHAKLFPRLGAVVHHGGAGTTHTAAQAGVPQVVLPHLLDQFYFAQRVWECGLSPRPLRVGRLTAARLAARIREAVEDPAMATRARAFSGALRARNGVDAALAVVERGRPATQATMLEGA